MALKFAVVREDPGLESALIARTGATDILVVASGGCTALSLIAERPRLRVTAFDLARPQLDHLTHKLEALVAGRLERLGLGSTDRDGLHQLGDFEALFRLLRSSVADLARVEPDALVDPDRAPEQREQLLHRAITSPYWGALFATLFADPLLHAMFGPAATQHAVPGSYPGYFQRLFERGLAARDAPANYFLRHIFAQDYRPGAAPLFLERPPTDAAVELVHGDLLAVPDLERFGVLSLSNIFDWSSDARVAGWADHLRHHTRPGARILIRQLNNDRDFSTAFAAPDFAIEHIDGARDRSLFYVRVVVVTRT